MVLVLLIGILLSVKVIGLTIMVLLTISKTEVISVLEIFNNPQHPYTRGLLGAIPSAQKPRGELTAIPGNVPATLKDLSGCSFAPRCALADSACAVEPSVVHLGKHAISCWKVQA